MDFRSLNDTISLTTAEANLIEDYAPMNLHGENHAAPPSPSPESLVPVTPSPSPNRNRSHNLENYIYRPLIGIHYWDKSKRLGLPENGRAASAHDGGMGCRCSMVRVKVLKEIWGKLGLAGRKEWDFGKDPCSMEGNWGSYVSCDCSFNRNTTCRVNGIYLIAQNVSTTLPSEFAKLPYLQNVELGLNYLSGTIPSEWATMRLRVLSLEGNRLSGAFPTVLTKITTLKYLSIEGNRFSGHIPKEIANLKNLDKLALSSNDFTGQLPVALAKLTNLKTLRISDNNFTGKIPDYISQWPQIENLHIQGCSFEGPIPSNISVLTRMDDLRISDLKGVASTFPRLKKMTHLKILVLRNCLIHGTIPEYVENLKNLITLTGNFINDGDDSGVYILSNTSNLNSISTSDTKLYTRARTAAISLTYYGLCLMNGKYTVRLHFAEIVFTQDHSSNSLGRRVFDVYVQGELKLKDFNIAKEAGGTGRAVIKSYLVNVKNNTLKIQLYWAGKGTRQIPKIGSYGPIISAISVDPYGTF
ncbi:hypothetical protein SSX86_007027 [Deinandra increscens subsp. villosa]|uniref:non-specific serine/threonine protein kinase n=1 Tax=Deinandra increscens subsp. villosa TaxID=3103831 RepID=A0AAP0H664_9ASTR